MRLSSKRFLPLLEAALADINLDQVSRRQGLELLADLLSEQIAAERDRCSRLCRERGATWRHTSLASSTIAAAREEARARANEATYLADLIDFGEKPE